MKVTLTIPKQPDPIVKTAVIPIIDAGDEVVTLEDPARSCRSVSRRR